MPYYLVAPTGHAVEIAPGPVCVGSDPGTQIALRGDLGVEPQHFVLVPDARGHRLQQLSPSAVTAVNGRSVQSQLLSDGDCIRFGQLELFYRSEPSLPTEPPAPSMQASEPPPLPNFEEPPPIPSIPSIPSMPTVTAEETEAPAPRLGSGYRIPESPRAIGLDDDADAIHSPVTALSNLGRVSAAADRARVFIEDQKVNQSMVGAIAAGVVVAAVASVAWAALSWIPLVFFAGIASGLGGVVGTAVKIGGKGFEVKFAYVGVICALVMGMFASYLISTTIDHMLAPAKPVATDEIAMVGASDDTNKALQDSLRSLNVDPAELVPPDEEMTAESDVNLGLLFMLFRPRSLIAYCCAMGAAYKTSCRTLTKEEAMQMQFT